MRIFILITSVILVIFRTFGEEFEDLLYRLPSEGLSILDVIKNVEVDTKYVLIDTVPFFLKAFVTPAVAFADKCVVVTRISKIDLVRTEKLVRWLFRNCMALKQENEEEFKKLIGRS